MTVCRPQIHTFQQEVAHWRLVAAFDAHLADTRWFWTGMVFTVCRGTCWWRISLTCSNRSPAGETNWMYSRDGKESEYKPGLWWLVEQLLAPVDSESESWSRSQRTSSFSHQRTDRFHLYTRGAQHHTSHREILRRGKEDLTEIIQSNGCYWIHWPDIKWQCKTDDCLTEYIIKLTSQVTSVCTKLYGLDRKIPPLSIKSQQ